MYRLQYLPFKKNCRRVKKQRNGTQDEEEKQSIKALEIDVDVDVEC